MDEIETFLDECRADPWFQSHPELVDRLESVLTKLYLDGEGAEWEAIWDRVCTILKRTSDTPIDGCQALAAVSRASSDSAAMADQRRFPRPRRAEPIPGGYVVRDANGQARAYLYSRDNPTGAGPRLRTPTGRRHGASPR
jgi:hypothetical protein